MQISNGKSNRHSDLNFDNFDAQVHDVDFNFDAYEMPAMDADQVTGVPEAQAKGTLSVTSASKKQKVGVYYHKPLCNLLSYLLDTQERLEQDWIVSAVF